MNNNPKTPPTLESLEARFEKLETAMAVRVHELQEVIMELAKATRDVTCRFSKHQLEDNSRMAVLETGVNDTETAQLAITNAIGAIIEKDKEQDHAIIELTADLDEHMNPSIMDPNDGQPLKPTEWKPDDGA